MLGRRLRVERRKLISRAPKPVVQSLQYKMNPLAARLQECNLQVGKSIEDAATYQTHKSHQYGHEERDDPGRIDVGVNIIE